MAATFALQLQELKRLAPDASDLLKIISFFDTESIPTDILARGGRVLLASPSNHTMETGGATILAALIASENALTRFVHQLQRSSFVGHHSSSRGPVVRIHDLLRFMIHCDMKKENSFHESCKLAVAVICSAFRTIEDPKLPQFWNDCEMFIPHIQSLSGWTRRSRIENADLVDVEDSIAISLSRQGRYIEAEVLLTRALEDCRKYCEVDSLDTLSAMHNMASNCHDRGRYSKAEALYNTTLSDRERILGKDHPNTLSTANNLALVYHRQWRHSEAETLLKQVLASRESQLGEEHPDTLTMYSEQPSLSL